MCDYDNVLIVSCCHGNNAPKTTSQMMTTKMPCKMKPNIFTLVHAYMSTIYDSKLVMICTVYVEIFAVYILRSSH